MHASLVGIIVFILRVHIVNEASLLFFTEGLFTHKDVYVQRVVVFFHLQSREFNQMQLFAGMVARPATLKRQEETHELYKAVRRLTNMLVKLRSENVSQDQWPQREGASSSRRM